MHKFAKSVLFPEHYEKKVVPTPSTENRKNRDLLFPISERQQTPDGGYTITSLYITSHYFYYYYYYYYYSHYYYYYYYYYYSHYYYYYYYYYIYIFLYNNSSRRRRQI